MRRTMLLIPLTLLFLVSAVQAAHEGRRSLRGYGQVGYYPSIEHMDTVQRLAHRLEDAARHVHRQAEAGKHHFTSREERALRRLHALEREARHFHRQVESYHENPAHTYDDFQDLVRAYVRAARVVDRDLHATGHVRRDFRPVEVLMDRLIDYYGGDDYYARRYPGYFEFGLQIRRH